MPKKQPELGIKSPFRLRVGIDTDGWKGVNYESDPGAILDDEFQEALNVRILPNGKVVGRGGSSKAITEAMDGCGAGMHDDGEGLPTKGYIFKGWLAEASEHDDLYCFDPDASTSLEMPFTGNTYTDQIFAVTADGERFLFGSWSQALNALPIFTVTPRAIALLANSDDSASWIVPATLFSIPANADVRRYCGSIVKYNGRYFVGVGSNNSGSSATAYAVYHWDGVAASPTLEDSRSNIAQLPLLAIDHAGELIAGIRTHPDGGSHATVIRRRNTGTWSNVSLPVGITNFCCLGIAMFDGPLVQAATYLCGYTNDGSDKGVILKWADGALSTVVGPLSAGTVVKDICAWGNYLFYLHSNTSTGACMVGRSDGVTWTDSHKDLFAQFGAESSVTYGSIAVIRRVLRVLALDGVGGNGTIYSPTLLDTSGAWAETAQMDFAVHPGGSPFRGLVEM
jgi:hypothetical protein